jgi:hypothetical protein
MNNESAYFQIMPEIVSFSTLNFTAYTDICISGLPSAVILDIVTII